MDLLQHPMHLRARRAEPSASSSTVPDAALPIGVEVELRSRFEDRWTHGFAVAVRGDAAYQVRRLSDGHVLPAWFPAQMLRARRRS